MQPRIHRVTSLRQASVSQRILDHVECFYFKDRSINGTPNLHKPLRRQDKVQCEKVKTDLRNVYPQTYFFSKITGIAPD